MTSRLTPTTPIEIVCVTTVVTGRTEEELAGLAQTMRSLAKSVDVGEGDEPLLDAVQRRHGYYVGSGDLDVALVVAAAEQLDGASEQLGLVDVLDHAQRRHPVHHGAAALQGGRQLLAPPLGGDEDAAPGEDRRELDHPATTAGAAATGPASSAGATSAPTSSTPTRRTCGR